MISHLLVCIRDMLPLGTTLHFRVQPQNSSVRAQSGSSTELPAVQDGTISVHNVHSADFAE